MERLALKLRREWGIDNYSPIDVFSLALDKLDNLTLHWLDADEVVSGCFSKTDDDYIILINSNISKGRQNFTLAHELYHLRFDKSTNSTICMKNSKNAIERRANNFASYFLMPKCALEEFYDKNNIKEWELKDIIKCEQLFQISHQAMLTRLHKDGYLEDDYFDNLKSIQGISDYAASLGFDKSLYKPRLYKKNYTLGNLIPLTEELYGKSQISKGLRNEIFLKNFRADLVYKTEEDNDFD